MDPQLELLTEHTTGDPTRLAVEVLQLVNFGYAGRDQETVAAHVDELVHLGLPAPEVTPCLFQLPVDRATTSTGLTVVGNATYGEAEFGLVRAAGDWFVCAASDHSDLEVERASTARSKAMYHDILSPRCWRLSEVAAHWDDLELSCVRSSDGEERTVQSGRLDELLAPHDLIREYERRLGEHAHDGTVILSGTIAGEPIPGGDRWSVRLADPRLGRCLEVSYGVRVLAEELR